MAPTVFPGMCATDYPEVFDLRAMPQQPAQPKIGQLPAEQIKQFFEKVE